MKRWTIAALFACPLFFGIVPAGAAPAADPPLSGQEMIAAADSVRNPGQAFRLTNRLTEFVAGKPRNQMTLIVFSREDGVTRQFSNLIRYSEPPRDAGKLVLLDGSRMWFYDPASKASIRISPQQRLIGQAANGDVTTANLARDYTATVIGAESLHDADRRDRACWHLDLTAATADAVYSRIEYWVEQGSYFSVKGKYYSDSGRLLKIAYFRNYESQLGRLRPTQTILIDAVDPAQVTTMDMADWRYQDIPDAWFQRDYLPRLRVD